MSEQTQIQTVSLQIDESSRQQGVRHTLQPKPQIAVDNRPRSQSYSYKSNVKIQPAIPEADSDDEETQVSVGIGNGNSTRTSFQKKPTSRSNSFGTTARKISEVRGYDNRGFSDNFQRGAVDSTRSSAISLQVQREQYCCCTRWTPFERRLALSVGILAGVIIALATAVGLLARSDGVDEKFMWKP